MDGFDNFILDEGSDAFRVIPERKEAKTGDILGEYFWDFGVSYFAAGYYKRGR